MNKPNKTASNSKKKITANAKPTVKKSTAPKKAVTKKSSAKMNVSASSKKSSK